MGDETPTGKTRHISELPLVGYRTGEGMPPMCIRCGVFVGDIELHDRWHVEMALPLTVVTTLAKVVTTLARGT